MAKHKKLIITSFLIFISIFLGLHMLLATGSYFYGGTFNISSQYSYPEIIEWMAESDISGKGVFVLKLSQEMADQFFFESARPEDQELPDDVLGAFIYINSFENDDIERVFGRVDIVNSTFSVFYQTKGTHEYFEDSYLYDYDNPIKYINIDYFSGYELSSITAVDVRINNLEIFINGENVDFHISVLE